MGPDMAAHCKHEQGISQGMVGGEQNTHTEKWKAKSTSQQKHPGDRWQQDSYGKNVRSTMDSG